MLPFDSWPKSEKFLLGLPSSSCTSLATRMSSEPEPQAGSQIRSPGLRLHELRQQRGNLGRRVELACLLAGPSGELADQVLVHVADDVAVPDPRRPQVEPGIVEVFQQVLEPPIALLGLPQGRFGVEVDVAKDVFELGLVGVLDLLQGDVDQFADVGGIAMGVEVVEVALLGDDEPFAGQGSLQPFLVPLVLVVSSSSCPSTGRTGISGTAS